MLKDYYYTDKEELDALRVENVKLRQELNKAIDEIVDLKAMLAKKSKRGGEKIQMANIREMRKRAGLTQVEVAKVLEISIDTLWRWETGAGEPRLSNMLKMSELFGCTVDELIGKNPTQPLPTQEPEQGEREAV